MSFFLGGLYWLISFEFFSLFSEELSTVPSKEPTLTVSPSLALIFPNTPLVGEGTSTFTLSVSSSTRGSSAVTLSPCDLSHFETVASVTDSLGLVL